MASKKEIAQQEYNRLISVFKKAKVDETKLELYDNEIMKVAELFAILETIKELPTIIYNKKNKKIQEETAAGKARVKYMAQYTSCMHSLSRDLLGTTIEEDNELDEFE